MNMLRGLYDTLFLWGYYWRGYALVYSSGHLVSRGSSRCASVRVETTPCSLFNVWEVLVGKWRERLHKGLTLHTRSNRKCITSHSEK